MCCSRLFVFTLWAVCALIPLEIHASFNGLWRGAGQASDSSGWSAPCERISYHFEQTPTVLNVMGGEVKCGDYEQTFDPVSLVIRSNKLFYEDIEVGTLSDDALEIFYADEIITLAYSFTKVRLSGSEQYVLNYKEHQSSQDWSIAVEGQLIDIPTNSVH